MWETITYLRRLFFVVFALTQSCNNQKSSKENDVHKDSNNNTIYLELDVKQHEGGHLRVNAYIFNKGNNSVTFATTPISKPHEPALFKKLNSDKIKLMVTIIPPANTKANEVFRDSDLGRVIVPANSLCKLFEYDIQDDEYKIKSVEVIYIAFPEKPYADYWSGELRNNVALPN